jgi:hypothetical protein
MILYNEKSSFKKQPKKETIQLLLNYSRTLKMVNVKGNRHIELHLN